MQRDYGWRQARHYDDLLAPQEIGKLAGDRAVARLNPGKLKSGPMPVVFDPRVGGTLIGHLIGEALLNSLAHAVLAGAFAHLGRAREAEMALAAFVAARKAEFQSRGIAWEGETIGVLAGSFRQMFRNEEDWELLSEGLRKAGLAE